MDPIQSRLREGIVWNPDQPKRFFKVKKGEYAEADSWLGIPVPHIRQVVKESRDISFALLEEMIRSPFNEERLFSLLVLVKRYAQGEREKTYRFYLDHLEFVNNWNLVDSSAPFLLGAYLFEKEDASFLLELAQKESIWKRRIAIVSTLYFIRKGRFDETRAVALALLEDKESLIQKAVGWMLREAGERDQNWLVDFLCCFGHKMGPTMHHSATEKVPFLRNERAKRGSRET